MFALPLNRTIQHRRLICLFLLTGLLATGAGVRPASAQRPVPPEGDIPIRAGDSEAEERKSPTLAFGLSLGGTVVPLLASMLATDAQDKAGLRALGLGLGPSLGNCYAENRRRVKRGLKIRGIGASVMGTGMVLGVASVFGGERAKNAALGVMGVGLGTVVGGAVYDIATAPLSAKEFNEAHDLTAQVAPTVGPRGDQKALALRVTF